MEVTAAIHFWDDMTENEKAMDRADRIETIETFLAEHNTCALATCDLEGNVRNTPVEYLYYDGCFWIMSEGGHKFQGLAVNANVSLAIYEKYEGFGKLSGLQMQGKAELVEFWSEEYLSYLSRRRISEAQIRKLPHPMYLLKIYPGSYDLLCSALKQQGYSVRQHLDLTNCD